MSDLEKKIERKRSEMHNRRRAEGEAEVPRIAPRDLLVLREVGATGDRLRQIGDEPEPPSPLPGLLDPEPGLHVLQGQNQSGKTSFALNLALAWATGEPPSPGADPLPGTFALIVSAEQPTRRLVRIGRRLAGEHSDGTYQRLVGWEDRVVIVGKENQAAREFRRLDERGVARLHASIEHARDHDDMPVGLLVLDSLRRLMKPGAAENSNDDITQFLDPIAQLAIDLKLWVLLVHHVGHQGREAANRAARGGSAIGDVSAVQLLLERDGPHHRKLKVSGNALFDREMRFRIAPDDAEPGEIRFFEASDEPSSSNGVPNDIRDYLGANEVLSTKELARRIREAETGKRVTTPGGGYERRARDAIEHGLAQKWIVDEGTGRERAVRLAHDL